MEKGYKVRSSDPQSRFFGILKAIFWVACGAREGQRGAVRGNEPLGGLGPLTSGVKNPSQDCELVKQIYVDLCLIY